MSLQFIGGQFKKKTNNHCFPPLSLSYVSIFSNIFNCFLLNNAFPYSQDAVQELQLNLLDACTHQDPLKE